MNLISSFVIVFGFTAIISAIISKLTILIFNHFGWVEDPKLKQAKTNNATALYPVPRGGGIPIFFSVLLAVIFFTTPTFRLQIVLFASLICLLVGLADDLKDISPTFRLFSNLLIAAIIVSSGIGIAYVSNPILPGQIINLSHPQLTLSIFGVVKTIWILSDLLAIFWIAWCMNIVGWATGVEGQLPGFASISAIFIGILGFRFSNDPQQVQVIILSAAVAGAYAGFLPFNFYPQKIMPGYSGKSLAGLLLSVLAIFSGAKVATVILLLAIPMLDAGFVLLRRLSRGRSPFKSDGYHFHHRLLQAGWGRRRISVFYWFLSFLAGSLSLTLNSQQKFYVFLGSTVIFLGSLTWLAQHNDSKSSQ